MSRKRNTYKSLYQIFPGIGFVISVMNLFSVPDIGFWAAYRFFMIAWFVGLLAAYFIAIASVDKPPKAFYRKWGPFYYMGVGMNKELVWSTFAVEAFIFCCLTVFTHGFLWALVHLLILLPSVPLMYLLISMLWVPSCGNVWSVKDVVGGIADCITGSGSTGSGGSSGNSSSGGSYIYDDKLPLGFSYLENYPGRSFSQKYDNYMYDTQKNRK